MNTLYTIGYQGHTLASLVAAVQARGAVLCDTRYRAWSHNPDWRPDSLRAQLGVSYWGCPELGNLNYNNGDEIKLNRPQGVLEAMRSTLRRYPVILMCGCRDHATCHRSVAAQWLAERIGCQVEHIPPGERDAAQGAGIPALTLTPPWGSLIAVAAQFPELGKHYETRSWSTRYRGPLLIHQAKSLAPIGGMDGLADVCSDQPFRDALRSIGIAAPADLSRGAIVARANLVAVHRTADVVNRISTVERAFGDYAPGRFAWELRDIQAVEPPLPARGAQGLWRWRAPEELEVAG